MQDIHCHILHGMDDGAATINEAVELCKNAVLNNINSIVLTPHFKLFSQVDEFIEKRYTKIKELQEQLQKEKIDVKLYAGAEVALSDGLFYCEDLSKLTINGSKYILAEIPFYKTSGDKILNYIDFILENSFIPIIPHPERHAYIFERSDIIDSLAERNVLFQVNITSFLGEFGLKAKRNALTMKKSRMIDFLATDVHDFQNRTNDLKQFIKSTNKLFNEKTISKLMFKNTKKVIENGEINIRDRSIIKKSIFSFEWGKFK
jgi:Capsular polysaccharide biosynthesis protein